MCSMHYLKYLKDNSCRMDGCKSLVYGDNLCKKHYYGGDEPFCIHQGCRSRELVCKNRCWTHYMAYYRRGSPEISPPLSFEGYDRYEQKQKQKQQQEEEEIEYVDSEDSLRSNEEEPYGSPFG